jgi:hypothetical protein
MTDQTTDFTVLIGGGSSREVEIEFRLRFTPKAEGRKVARVGEKAGLTD